MSFNPEIKKYQDLLDLYATFDDEKLKDLNHELDKEDILIE